MLCSFVIPAHDEEDWIAGSVRAIQSAAGQLKIEYEIIVVADSCTDRTAAIAAEFGASVLEVDCRQIGASRNAGARLATGEFLFFVDADTEVTLRAVELALEELRAGAVGGGSTLSFDGPIPFFMRLMIKVTSFMLATARYTGGCFFFCHRSKFELVGGFDESLFIAEEIFLARDLKKHGRFVIVRGRVLTSARKVRNHTLKEVGGIIWRTFVGGKKSCQRREGLEFWYGKRQADPGHSMGERASSKTPDPISK